MQNDEDAERIRTALDTANKDAASRAQIYGSTHANMREWRWLNMKQFEEDINETEKAWYVNPLFLSLFKMLFIYLMDFVLKPNA